MNLRGDVLRAGMDKASPNCRLFGVFPGCSDQYPSKLVRGSDSGEPAGSWTAHWCMILQLRLLRRLLLVMSEYTVHQFVVYRGAQSSQGAH